MRTHLLLGACVCAIFSRTLNAQRNTSARTPVATQAQEYAGVYQSTPEEDYFTPCGIDGVGDTWSLRFRETDSQAPFLKKVTASRGYTPLTHFIRIRGRLGAPGRYNRGFQTRELAVDTVLEVKESLEPCAGFGVPATWSRVPPRFGNAKGVALSTDHKLAALLDIDGSITIWSTETGELVRKLGPVARGHASAATYGPITFSNDGTLLSAGSVDGIVRVWRVRDGRRIFSLRLKDSAAVAKERAKLPPRPEVGIQPLPPNSYAATREVIFNKRGTMLATTNTFSSIVWSLKTGKKLAEFDRGTVFLGKIFFVGDEGLLTTADSGRMKLRSYLGAEPVTRTGTRARATERMTISPDGRQLAVNGWGDTVFLWSLANGPGPALPVPPFVAGVIDFSPDGNTIATAGGMYGLYLWDVRTGAPIRSFHNFPGPISHAWFSGDGKSIVTISTFDDRFRIVYLDSSARPAGEKVFDDSLTAKIPLGPPPSSSPRTVAAIVTGPNERAVAGAEATISNGDMPDSVIMRATTSPGGYVSFPGIRFRHIIVRASKPGFATGVLYIHLNRWENEGPWGIQLKPETGATSSTSP